jgi:hypothetical protein
MEYRIVALGGSVSAHGGGLFWTLVLFAQYMFPPSQQGHVTAHVVHCGQCQAGAHEYVSRILDVAKCCWIVCAPEYLTFVSCCFAVATSTLLFGTVISPLNGAGILVVLVASAWYSYISVVEENASKLARHRVLKAAESDLDDVEVGGGGGDLGDTETDALLDSSSRSGKSASMVHRK